MKLVWISLTRHRHLVAPRRGAWIETARRLSMTLLARRSHPAGVRGLKLMMVNAKRMGLSRTPQGCVD